MRTIEHAIRTADGVALAGTLTRPDSLSSRAPCDPAHDRSALGSVVIASALGVPRRYYAAFTRFLAEGGFASLSFDYRGIGDSRLEAGRPATMEAWGRLDIDAALETAARELGAAPLFLLGHSCGGQLFGLAPASERLAGAILVAAQLGNWRRWPWPWNLGLLALWHGIIPALSLAGRSFPARRFGLSSVDVPSGVMAEWARWARQPEYLFSPRFRLDTRRYAAFRFPLLAYAFDDDHYAPWPAVRALLERLPATAMEVRRIAPAAIGVGPIGHFGFFREPLRASLWSDTLAWLRRAVAAADPPTDLDEVADLPLLR